MIAACDVSLIVVAPSSWALPVCVAVCYGGIGLSSVAATEL